MDLDCMLCSHGTQACSDLHGQMLETHAAELSLQCWLQSVFFDARSFQDKSANVSAEPLILDSKIELHPIDWILFLAFQ